MTSYATIMRRFVRSNHPDCHFLAVVTKNLWKQVTAAKDNLSWQIQKNPLLKTRRTFQCHVKHKGKKPWIFNPLVRLTAHVLKLNPNTHTHTHIYSITNCMLQDLMVMIWYQGTSKATSQGIIISGAKTRQHFIVKLSEVTFHLS